MQKYSSCRRRAMIMLCKRFFFERSTKTKKFYCFLTCNHGLKLLSS